MSLHRDLMKWCRRIAVDFDISQISTANAVHQEAIDCFCACIAKTDKLFPLVEAIGAKLNITKAKVNCEMNLLLAVVNLFSRCKYIVHVVSCNSLICICVCFVNYYLI